MFLILLNIFNNDLLFQMVQFLAVVSNGQLKQRRMRIKSIYNDYFSQPGTSPFLSQMVANFLNLMNWQAAEEEARKIDLVGESTLYSLFHCSRNHQWTDTAGGMPVLAFAKQYQVPDGQMEFVILTERASNHSWCDLETVFERKNLLKKAFLMHIPLDRVIQRLHALEAPQATLYFFLNHVPDLGKRLSIARNVNCAKAIIDSYVGLKLKADLMVYKDTLSAGSPERFYADKCIAKFK